jgi:hypothetical protein
MGIFEGSAQVLGEIIGFGITAVLFIVCLLPIYFIFKLMSGSTTTFKEDLKEYLAWRWGPQPRPETLSRPETLRILFALDSVESTVLEIYKYVLIVGLILASVFVVWFFIKLPNASERSFLAIFFGAGYLFLLFWVVGNLVMIKRRQARRSLAAMAQSASPATEQALRASIDPASPADIKTSPSEGSRMTPLGLTQQEIIIVIMVFVFVAGTVSVVLLMLWFFPRLIS